MHLLGFFFFFTQDFAVTIWQKYTSVIALAYFVFNPFFFASQITLSRRHPVGKAIREQYAYKHD